MTVVIIKIALFKKVDSFRVAAQPVLVISLLWMLPLNDTQEHKIVYTCMGNQ